MKVNDVMACSFPSWYEKFKKCTIKSIVIPLTTDVLAYMQDNGTLVLPEGSQPEPEYRTNTEDESDSYEDWEHCRTTGTSVEGPKLEEFNAKVNDAIKKLGGSAFPKLNWSSPKDASWIALNKSLRCSTAGDVYLLLKSSNFVAHDLTSPFKDCDDEPNTSIDYYFILRKWMEINPSNEFRCFVRNKELIGICQRDTSQSYGCIGSDKTRICSDIVSFWRENIENRFPLSCYTFDVYRPAKDHVTLVDFNPFGETTDGLLFTWSELKQKEDTRPSTDRTIEEVAEEEEQEGDIIQYNERNLVDSNRQTDSVIGDTYSFGEDGDTSPEFRYISDATGVQPSPYMQYGLPLDIVDLSTGQDPQKLMDFLQMKIQSEADESSDEEVPS
ncbi:cell division cycle protein 123 homolog [Penaeus chinensis]|uniref:cell division cycle protein 123 homolog n=1 Tax=Penaeus chinensis TaxID=139456 RepID=UPI001FB6F58B|nr:cell division cycle protein 123 homolog [Penaeus chinensis]